MELKLTVRNGSLAGQTFDLSEGHLLIGRSPNCSVKFDPFQEKVVSSQHAFIENRDGDFIIRDNSSTNGTFLNGTRVSEARLNDGDVVGFGPDGIEADVSISRSDAQATREMPASGASPVFTPTVAIAGVGGGYAVPAPSAQVELKQTIAGFGLSQPNIEAPKPVDETSKYVIAILMGLVLLLFVLPVLVLLGFVLGPIVFVLAAFVAFLPVPLYLAPLIWLDRYDPEPIWLLLLCFSWGAIFAVLVSAIVNDLFSYAAYSATGSPPVAELAGAVISAPIIEETTKGIGVVALLLFFRRNFDDILDGIVFAGVIALGFAAVENVLYYGRVFIEEGFEGLSTLFVVRGIFSPFAHVTFTAMTGIGCGIARESHNWFVRIAAPLAGFILGILLHMLWNFMTLLAMLGLQITGMIAVCDDVGFTGRSIGYCGFSIAYIVLQIPLFVIFLSFTLYMMRRQNRILKEMLAIDVARGLIKQEHLDISRSIFRSTIWIFGGLGDGKFLARRRYLSSIGRLGLSYWHIQRATAAQGQTGSFQQNPYLRAEVEKYGALV